MTGTEIINKSIFGKIDSSAETMDGRNIGQMKNEMATYIDGILGNVSKALAAMSKLDAEVAIVQAFEQAVSRKLWKANSLDVYVIRNGQKAIQGVNVRDISEMLAQAVRNA